MAARELEKEIAAKQNKPATPQLTKKQQEMLQQQLDQEQAIRENVKKVIGQIRLSANLSYKF